MSQNSHVIQCATCRTFQVEAPQSNEHKFECKMCHSAQFVAREWYRGNGRECRFWCMKMNNQRIESDGAFMDSPRDRMNGSLRSELGDSFGSQHSFNQSFSSTHASSSVSASTEEHIVEDDEEMATEDNTSFGAECKRKHGLVVTPQKDRESKRQKSSPVLSPNLGLLFRTSHIRAQFKFQHLQNGNNENSNFGSGIY